MFAKKEPIDEQVKVEALDILLDLEKSLRRGQTQAYGDLRYLVQTGIDHLSKPKVHGLEVSVQLGRTIRDLKAFLKKEQVVLLAKEQELLSQLISLSASRASDLAAFRFF